MEPFKMYEELEGHFASMNDWEMTFMEEVESNINKLNALQIQKLNLIHNRFCKGK